MSSLVRELRMRKDAKEIERMKHAAKVVDRVFEELLSWDLVGMRERELALKMEMTIRELSDGISFPPIVASGENAATHTTSPAIGGSGGGGHGHTRLRGGEVEGLLLGHNQDDSHRKAGREAGGIYETVKEAQERAYRTVREGGIPAREIDRAARETIAEAGYGRYFTHRTGHGLGLDVHEEPYIGPDGEVVLGGEGMTFTIEPGYTFLASGGRSHRGRRCGSGGGAGGKEAHEGREGARKGLRQKI